MGPARFGCLTIDWRRDWHDAILQITGVHQIDRPAVAGDHGRQARVRQHHRRVDRAFDEMAAAFPPALRKRFDQAIAEVGLRVTRVLAAASEEEGEICEHVEAERVAAYAIGR